MAERRKRSLAKPIVSSITPVITVRAVARPIAVDKNGTEARSVSKAVGMAGPRCKSLTAIAAPSARLAREVTASGRQIRKRLSIARIGEQFNIGRLPKRHHRRPRRPGGLFPVFVRINAFKVDRPDQGPRYIRRGAEHGDLLDQLDQARHPFGKSGRKPGPGNRRAGGCQRRP